MYKQLVTFLRMEPINCLSKNNNYTSVTGNTTNSTYMTVSNLSAKGLKCLSHKIYCCYIV